MKAELKLIVELAKMDGQAGAIAVVSPAGEGLQVLRAFPHSGSWAVVPDHYEGVGYEAFQVKAADLGLANVHFVDLPALSLKSEEGIEWDASQTVYAAWKGNFPEVYEDLILHACVGYLGGYVSEVVEEERELGEQEFYIEGVFDEWLDALKGSGNPELETFANEVTADIEAANEANDELDGDGFDGAEDDGAIEVRP